MTTQAVKPLTGILPNARGTPNVMEIRAGREFLTALDGNKNIFKTADNLLLSVREIVLPLDGTAIKFIEQTAEMIGRRNQLHMQHFELAKLHLEHAHSLEEKAVSVRMMVESAKMARNDANQLFVAKYGKEAAKTALELAAEASDNPAAFRKLLDLAFSAAGWMVVDGEQYWTRGFYRPFSQAAIEVVKAGPLMEEAREKYLALARHYSQF
ncbi:Uncharacterised protein [uncultured archaeon]|nr:Uncharacterised protein [uncultured archaeon]